ncbi:hypothetical protein QQ020_21310 [Fulvivirgaceae bacterium BMA12]|uniref:Uncharacterized protein n=1 Tax=Agaribacillus aureus TaxID=3051825 RepID=A0ABT8LA52_9BACT|nr:hypothetical protein [Fulvivirgaceae bacterium BMA12]
MLDDNYYKSRISELKNKGYTYAKIRHFLNNSGLDDDKIAKIIFQIDQEEYQTIAQRQQQQKLIKWLIFDTSSALIGIVYSIIILIQTDQISSVDMVVFIATLAAIYKTYTDYQRVKIQNHPISQSFAMLKDRLNRFNRS